MHPGLDPAYVLTHYRPFKRRVGVYEHRDYPLRVGRPVAPADRMRNDDQEAAADPLRVLEFLGSSEVVVTSAYHGLYWATLLGRKVVVANMFSSKFAAFPYPPALPRAQDTLEGQPSVLPSERV